MFTLSSIHRKCTFTDVIRKNGFSLIELLVGLSILTIILCFSVSFAPLLYKKNQLQTMVHTVKTAINFARTEALSTGDVLVLTHLPGAIDWSEGMLLFVDNGNHHRYTPNSKLVHEWRWNPAGIRMQWRGFQSTEYLLFSPDITSSAVNGYFLISNTKGEVKLVINRLGRLKETI